MFKNIQRKLLFSYLSVMGAILGTSITFMYYYIRYNLYQRIDHHLVTLADAAAHSLPEIKVDAKAIANKIPQTADNDGDLDIPWQDLQYNNQGVEWFDAKKQLLGKGGRYFPEVPLLPEFNSVQKGKIRTLTIPVFGTNKQLQGYIRVSESTEKIDEELNLLGWGLTWGGVTAIILSGIGGWWLTRQSLKPIESSFQKLKQFTTDASHELRTPLTAIKTSVAVMQNHPERIHPADVKKFQAIESATNQINHLIEDLLLLARTDVTTAISTTEWLSIPLDELLEDLVDFLLPQAQEKKITLKLTTISDIFVKGNPYQIKRLFSNLLTNALQYTPMGGMVTVSMAKSDHKIIVTIADTGIGIAPEHLALVFDRFWREDRARNHRDGGMGLGLAISLAIAQSHGGEITVRSQVGVGSVFSVRLSVISRE